MHNRKTFKKVRLPKDVIPVEYDIKLHPDLENFTFSGAETITLILLKPTKTLTLHSKEIQIDTALSDVGRPTRDSKIFAKISYNEKAETATFAFPKALPKGKTKITITFKGILNDKMRGFYRSSYIYEGKVHNMATTQFEATDARRAFPCFDEPAHKAVFHVSLVVPKGKTAISNTLPVSKIEHEAGFEVVKFAPSPKMSTYLLAFIVGDFEYIEKKSKNGVLVRVYTTPGKTHQADFALDCAVKTLEFYEEYFDIKYPLNTLDMIAIPDFSSGAMENWGAVTYRESMLLVDEKNSSLATKQWVALVIAHELAHQWFGNLVTMEWWTHLWLNEGFASYIEYLAVDKMFPNWEIWTQFATHDLGSALRLDALLNTHPIEIPVHHPSEIGEIFDEVSYSKGASVIRMLASYLGEETFRDGLRHYLKKHSYKNTETLHLWESFNKVSKKQKENVAKIMQNWTSKGGYPVIQVESIGNKLKISQQRFFSSPISAKKTKDKTLWQVPVSFLHDDSSTKLNKILLSTKNTSLQYDNAWVKINAGETSFYRTAYSKQLLEKLHLPVKNKMFSPSDRLGIVRDLFALAEAGVVPATHALEFLSAYENEENYTVWVEIASGIGKIEQLIAKTKHKENLDRFVLKIFENQFKRLGFASKHTNEDHADTLLRSLVISRLGRSGHPYILKESRRLFNLVKNDEHIDPNLRSVVYSLVAKNGGKNEYNSLIEMYKKETMHEEKNRIGYALCDFEDVKILEEVIKFAFSKDVRVQDTERFLGALASNPLGRDLWFKVLKNNWKVILERYGQGGYTLSRIVKSISATPEKKHLQLFDKFFKTHSAPGAERSIEQVKERITSNILWLERDGKKIGNFLKDS